MATYKPADQPLSCIEPLRGVAPARVRHKPTCPVCGAVLLMSYSIDSSRPSKKIYCPRCSALPGEVVEK